MVYDLADSGHLGYHLLIFKAQVMVYGEYIQSFSFQQAVESQNFVPYAATCYALIWIANNMSQGLEPLDPTLLAKNINFYYNNVQ